MVDTHDPDVVVVGAGIAGAAIATVLARAGLGVLLLERQVEYRDRVRGEYMAPWGVLEARALGLEDVLRATGAVDARYHVPYGELTDPSVAEADKSDASSVLPGVDGALCASHPLSCRALADAAVRAGAGLVRGVLDVRVRPGMRPEVAYRDGTHNEVRPRLVIGADGRTSVVRQQARIRLGKAPPTHVIAGMLVEGATRWPEDEYSIGVEGNIHFYVFPQGAGRIRLYTCLGNDEATRWAGREGPQRFVDAIGQLRSIPAARGLGDVAPAGPCATFNGEQTWCDEPYADGVVLIGDAGGYDDPVAGQGLSLAMSDVQQLSEALLAADDWTVGTMRSYGEGRAKRLRRMRRVSTTYAALMTTFTPEGRARRARYRDAVRAGREDVGMALQAMMLGPDRLPGEAFTNQLHESILA